MNAHVIVQLPHRNSHTRHRPRNGCVCTPADARILIGSANNASLSQGLVGYWPLDGAVTN